MVYNLEQLIAMLEAAATNVAGDFEHLTAKTRKLEAIATNIDDCGVSDQQKNELRTVVQSLASLYRTHLEIMHAQRLADLSSVSAPLQASARIQTAQIAEYRLQIQSVTQRLNAGQKATASDTEG